jgi:hypothetical protein
VNDESDMDMMNSVTTDIKARIKKRIFIHHPLIDKGARILRSAFEFVAHLVFSFAYRNTPKVLLPPVRNEILLKSAVDIAKDIRERKVRNPPFFWVYLSKPNVEPVEEHLMSLWQIR